MTIQQIASDTILDNFDTHIKITAGPGAGKTYWVSNHVKNIVARSARLRKCGMVLCISYTNVASETMRKKLKEVSDNIESCTIHSFLFRYIVRPYLHLLTKPDGSPIAAHEKVQNHYDASPSYGLVSTWLDNIGKARLKSIINSKTYDYLKSILWIKDESGEWSLKPIIKKYPPKYFPTTKLIDYKYTLWEKGIIEHDDVLYLSYRILSEYPKLQKFVSSRFPYVCVDEFQDTDPRQTEIIKWLGEAGSFICVIGDAQQSIYGFCGARMEDFINFNLTGIVEYEICNNRRSTDNIVKILNRARKNNPTQIGIRNIQGNIVTITKGTHHAGMDKAHSLCGNEKVITLARNNSNVDSLRINAIVSSNPWEDESIGDRLFFLKGAIEAIPICESNRFGAASKSIIEGLRIRSGKSKIINFKKYLVENDARAISVSILSYLGANLTSIKDKSLFDFYADIDNLIQKCIPCAKLTQIQKGKFKSFSENMTIGQLMATLKMSDENRMCRTIHQAKSDEFDNVLLCLDDESKLDYIFFPSAVPDNNAEEQRITYVAISRAKNRLFINVPLISEEKKNNILALNLPVQIEN